MRIIKRSIILLIFFISLFFDIPVYAQSNKQPVLNVGYTHSYPFFTQDPISGRYRGFFFEFLECLSNNLNVDFAYHECKGDQCIKGLLDGKLDMVPLEVSPSYKFTQYPFIINNYPMASTAMYLALNEKLSIDNATSKHPYVIGYKRRTTTINDILNSFKNNGFDYNDQFIFKEYESYDDLFNDFYSKKIDGLVESELKRARHANIVLKLYNDSLKLVFNQNNAEYLSKIDSAIFNIEKISSSFSFDLFGKYAPKTHDFMLSPEERNVLKEHPQLKTASEINRKPLSYFEKGVHLGLTAEMMHLLIDQLDLKFYHLDIGYSNKTIDSLSQGKIDIIPAVPSDYNFAREHNIDITIPYIKYVYVSVKRNDSIKMSDKPVIAIVDNRSFMEKVSMIFPKARYVKAKNIQECLKLVQNGYADLAFVNNLENNELFSTENFYDLQVNSAISFEQEFSIALSKKLDYRFLNIFNKAIVAVDTNKKEDLILKYSLLDENVNGGLKAFIFRHPLFFSEMLGCIFVAILLFFLCLILIRQNALEKIKKIAYTDKDTGYGNANWFEKNVPLIIEEHNQSGSKDKLYIIVSEIPQTSVLRSTYGYIVLKKALMNVGVEHKDKYPCILAYVMSSEITLRYALCKASSDTQIKEIFSSTNHSSGLLKIAGIKTKITMNHGICPVPQTGTYDIDTLISRANLARMDAVKAGLSVGLYDDKMIAHMLLLQKMEDVMEKALAENEFKVYIQPKYDILTRKTVGGEALVRWESPELGFVRPDEFIPLFEQNSFIVQLDNYMLRQVCLFQKQRITDGKAIVPISVNQSGVCFAQENYLKSLEAISHEFNLPAGAVNIELTETVFVDMNSKEPRKNLAILFLKIKRLGFSLSMDDFSKGYSSLSNLVNLPIDVIKIDRAILIAAGKSNRICKMLHTIVLMANSLDLEVICEGIETQEQESILIKAGCILGQGYLYSKPLFLDDFTKFLAEHELESKSTMV